MNAKIEVRQSNFELLRLIAMFFIVVFHFNNEAGFSLVSFDINTVFIQWMHIWGKIGVNIFLLLTGYFGICSGFKLRNFLKLYVLTLFYTVLFNIIFSFSHGNVTWSVKWFMPWFHDAYWFISVYLILYCFIPFINAGIKGLTQKQHKYLILFALLIWSVIPTFLGRDVFYFSIFGWFMVVYLIGAYIRLYSIEFFDDKKRDVFFIILFLVICLIYILLNDLAALNVVGHLSKIVIFRDYSIYENNSFLLFSIALFFFFLFKNIHLAYNKSVNFLSASTLSIYLIHYNPHVRVWLFYEFFKNRLLQSSIWLIPYMFIMAVNIFFICICLDKIRYYSIAHPLMNFFNKKAKK